MQVRQICQLPRIKHQMSLTPSGPSVYPLISPKIAEDFTMFILPNWLVVYLPLWKIWVNWDYYSQYIESKIHVPNHQPVILPKYCASNLMMIYLSIYLGVTRMTILQLFFGGDLLCRILVFAAHPTSYKRRVLWWRCHSSPPNIDLRVSNVWGIPNSWMGWVVYNGQSYCSGCLRATPMTSETSICGCCNPHV